MLISLYHHITVNSSAVTMLIPLSPQPRPARGDHCVFGFLSLAPLGLPCLKELLWAQGSPMLSDRRRLNEKFSFMNNLI